MVSSVLALVLPLEETKSFLRTLEKSDVGLITAYWLFDFDRNAWHLNLCTKKYPTSNYHSDYDDLRAFFKQSSVENITTSDIYLITADTPLVKSIISTYKKYPEVCPTIDKPYTVKNAMIGKEYVDEIYIFYVNPSYLV